MGIEHRDIRLPLLTTGMILWVAVVMVAGGSAAVLVVLHLIPVSVNALIVFLVVIDALAAFKVMSDSRNRRCSECHRRYLVSSARDFVCEPCNIHFTIGMTSPSLATTALRGAPQRCGGSTIGDSPSPGTGTAIRTRHGTLLLRGLILGIAGVWSLYYFLQELSQGEHASGTGWRMLQHVHSPFSYWTNVAVSGIVGLLLIVGSYVIVKTSILLMRAQRVIDEANRLTETATPKSALSGSASPSAPAESPPASPPRT